MTLSSGTRVTYLSSFFNREAWDYIETTVDGKTVRGFIPAGGLDRSQSTDTDDIGK